MSNNKQFWQRPVQKFNNYIRTNRRVRQFIVPLGFVIVGLALLIITRAATPTANVESENGSGSVSVLNAASASAGKFVKFGTSGATTSGPVIKVSGNKFINQSGQTIQLRGVNRPGVESSCIQRGDSFITSPWSTGVGGAKQGDTVAYADTVVNAFLTWDNANTPVTGPHAINAVRIPLSEDCWLGNGSGSGATLLSGMPAAYTGTPYQQFVIRMVNDLRDHGMYAIIDDHWGSNGNWLSGTSNGKICEPNPIGCQNGQQPADSVDHSLAFWTSVGQTFKTYTNIMYDIENEPNLSCEEGGSCPANIASLNTYPGQLAKEAWALNLYLNGGPYLNTKPCSDSTNPDGSFRIGGYYAECHMPGVTWQIAGTQQIVNTIRTTGSCSPIAVSTIGGGNGAFDLLGNYMPKDPVTTACPLGNQVALTFHAYDFSGQNYGGGGSTTTLDYDLANPKVVVPNADPSQTSFTSTGGISLTANYPIYVGEWGSGNCPDGNAAANTYIVNSIANMNSRGISYTAWAWDSGEAQGSPCEGPSLVGPTTSYANETGTVTTYGALVKAGLQAKQGQP